MMTIGRGGMSAAEYRTELALYAVLGAPLLLCSDLRRLDAATLAALTNPELIAANQDADCTQGTLLAPIRGAGVRGDENWAGQRWARPLSDGSFLVALVNTDPVAPRNLSVTWGRDDDSDFFPAAFGSRAARVRDVLGQADVGTFQDAWLAARVPPHDVALVRVYPV